MMHMEAVWLRILTTISPTTVSLSITSPQYHQRLRSLAPLLSSKFRRQPYLTNLQKPLVSTVSGMTESTQCFLTCPEPVKNRLHTM